LPFPVYLNKQTFRPSVETSQSGHFQTRAVQKRLLFDYFIGELLKMHRHVDAERFGGLEVDYQLELGRLLNR
jgi:hypothetical protein